MKRKEDLVVLVVNCIRQQLVVMYLGWLAAAGISLVFIIMPGWHKLAQFRRTECTTVKAVKSGANACTFCAQIHVTTQETPNIQRQLQRNEITVDQWVR